MTEINQAIASGRPFRERDEAALEVGGTDVLLALVTFARVNGNLDCNDGELLHRWAVEGLGIAWRSTWEIAAELERGDLVTVLDTFALPSYDIHAVYPQHRHVPARLRLFVAFLKAIYARAGYWSHGT